MIVAEAVSLTIATGALAGAVGVLGKLAVQTFRPSFRDRRLSKVRAQWAATYQLAPLAHTTSHRRVVATAPGMAMW